MMRRGSTTTWIVGVVAIFFLAVLLCPSISTSRPVARTASCLSNLKQIARACSLYMDDYDDRLPRATAWQDAANPYLNNPIVFRCPEVVPSPVSYAYNAALDRAKRKEIADPASAPLAFDSYAAGPNATDWLQSFARRHEWQSKRGWGSVAFVDGHVHPLRAAPPAGAGLRQAGP